MRTPEAFAMVNAHVVQVITCTDVVDYRGRSFSLKPKLDQLDVKFACVKNSPAGLFVFCGYIKNNSDER